MTVLQSLRNRAGMIAFGLASFVVMLGLMRWSSGDALIQPSADAGVGIGAALVALYFVLNDTRGGGRPSKGRDAARAPELN